MLELVGTVTCSYFDMLSSPDQWNTPDDVSVGVDGSTATATSCRITTATSSQKVGIRTAQLSAACRLAMGRRGGAMSGRYCPRNCSPMLSPCVSHLRLLLHDRDCERRDSRFRQVLGAACVPAAGVCEHEQRIDG